MDKHTDINGYLLSYLLHLADSSLIMGHRLSEWAAHGPTLEQDIALSNIALDLIGQSRNFYQYAAQVAGNDATEDTLAYFRNPEEFNNLLITELPNGDWAKTTLKLFFFSAFQYFLFKELINSADTQMSAIAEKSFKEVTYHLRWSSEWVVRLGDGTDESHRRMQVALKDIYPYTLEMFEMEDYEKQLFSQKITIDISIVQRNWNEKIQMVVNEAKLSLPIVDQQKGGKSGNHTSYLKLILNEMQHLQRSVPGCEW